MSTNQIINDIIPRTQFIATSGQTVFNAAWTADVAASVIVYARADGVSADDATQVVSDTNYTVTFIGSTETVRVTFSVGRTLNDIITLVRNTDSSRLNLYTNTNFTPSMLNQDFGILTLVDQQAQTDDSSNTPSLRNPAPRYNLSSTFKADVNADLILPILGASQYWVMDEDLTSIIAVDVPSSGTPDNSYYFVGTLTPTLANSFNFGALGNGMLKQTVTSDISTPEIASSGLDYWAPGNVLTVADAPVAGEDVTNKTYVDAQVTGAGSVASGLINQLAWYSATGTEVSGLTTAASKILVTDGSSVPSLSSELPAFDLGGTLNTNDQVITNSVTDGDITLTTNGAGLLILNATQGIEGVSNDATMSADSATLVPTQAAAKAYADTISSGFSFVTGGACVCSTTGDFASAYNNGAAGVGATLTQSVAAIVTLDGVTVTINQRILVSFQTNPEENGIYQISTLGTGAVQAVLTRTTDFDTAAEITAGSLVAVTDGTLYGGSVWSETETVTTVGTDPVEFIIFAQPSNTFVTLATNQSITGAKSFDSSKFKLSGSTSGTTTINATAIAGTTVITVPAATDTLVGKATTDTLTNKSISGATNTLSAVPYTALANGTAGQIISWDAGGAISAVSTGTAGQVLQSNGAGAEPTFVSVSGLIFTAPTVQSFLTGSGTYTTPTSPAPVYIKVMMSAAGGGGSGSAVGGGAVTGTAGGNSTFGGLACNGGSAGVIATRGAGGAASVASNPGFNVTGGSGTPGQVQGSGGGFQTGGTGGNNPLGGAGAGGINSTGFAAESNTGAGGGGAGGASAANLYTGTGGGAGGYLEAYLGSPSATYSYAVGASGAAGPAGGSGLAGGNGGSGVIVVTEYYQ